MSLILAACAGGFVVSIFHVIRYRWMVEAFRHEIIGITAERKFWQRTARERVCGL